MRWINILRRLATFGRRPSVYRPGKRVYREGKQTGRVSKRGTSAKRAREGNGLAGSSSYQPALPVSAAETERMRALRGEGWSIHAIARELGRSSRTVHTHLSNGAEDLKRRPEAPQKEWGERLLEQVEPAVLQAAQTAMERDPSFIKRFIAAQYDLTLPTRTLNDLLRDGLDEFPDLRERFVTAKIQEIERGGRSEMDILREGVDIIVDVLEQLERGRWARVAQSAVSSGEATNIVRELLDFLRREKPPEPPVRPPQPQTPEQGTPSPPAPVIRRPLPRTAEERERRRRLIPKVLEEMRQAGQLPPLPTEPIRFSRPPHTVRDRTLEESEPAPDASNPGPATEEPDGEPSPESETPEDEAPQV